MSIQQRLIEAFRELPNHPLRKFLRAWVLTILPFSALCGAASVYPRVEVFIAMGGVAALTQNALGVLMHEGSQHFFHANNKTNDLLADFLVCLWIFNTVEGYRRPHLEHHRSSGEPKDPYYPLYSDYRSRWDIACGLLFDLTGISAIRIFVTRYGAEKPSQPMANQPRYALPGLLVVQAALFFGLWQVTGVVSAYLFVWLGPLMTVPIAINRLRTLAEHYDGGLGPPPNRTTPVGWLEYLLVAPYGYANHFEHHLAPAIPYYRLSWAHRFLRDQGVEFKDSELNENGYCQSFWRLWSQTGRSNPG